MSQRRRHAAGVAQVAGDSNIITATGRISADMPEDVLKALLAIQTAVSAHPAARALTDAAVQDAKKPSLTSQPSAHS